MKDGISIVMAYYDRKIQLYRTLKSIVNSSYDKKKLEIIIVNDASDNIDDVKIDFPTLNFQIYNVTEEEKNWKNCSIPYNIGFSLISYDKVIIQSPECYHMGDILNYVSKNLKENDYISFASYSLSYDEYNNNDYDNIQFIDSMPKFILQSGWYNHSLFRPVYYHFCSAMSYSNLCELNGFNETLKDGIGYDDDDLCFRIKLLGLNMKIVDNPFVLHQWHDNKLYHYIPSDGEENANHIEKLLNDNRLLYEKMKLKNSYTITNNTYFNKSKKVKNTEKKLNIGITLPIWDKVFSIWGNGIRQNAIFLAQTLMNIGKYNVYIVSNGPVPIDDELVVDWNVKKIKTIVFNDIKYNLDILFALGSEVTLEEGDFLKKRGCKIVYYNCGSQYIYNIENILRGDGQGVLNFDMYDELWMIPQMENTSYHYLETISRKKVRVVPFVWSPMFLDKVATTLPNNGRYVPSNNPKRITSFEPNINIVKYCMYPILITEKVYRKRPDLIKHMYVTNSLQLYKKEQFVNIMFQLDLVKNGLTSFDGRYPIPWFLSTYTDAVVSHQWENALNYMYLDVIYMGYPLIHNAHLVKDCGYYYEGFNAEQGAEQLLYALTEHDKHLEEYNEKNKKTIERFHTDNPKVVKEYDILIEKLLNK